MERERMADFRRYGCGGECDRSEVRSHDRDDYRLFDEARLEVGGETVVVRIMGIRTEIFVQIR